MSEPMSGSPGPKRDAASPEDILPDPFLTAGPAPAAPAHRRARTPWLAVVAVTMTALFLAAAAAAVWLWRWHALGPAAPPPRDDAADAPDPTSLVPPPAPRPPRGVTIAPAPRPSAAPPAPSAPAPRAVPSILPGGVPAATVSHRSGAITVVDLGVRSDRTLEEELALQRAEAQANGETLLLVTTELGSQIFADFEAALPDPLMQAALAHVRVVRADVRYFAVELADGGFGGRGYPWFFLLAPDLSPRDGINGGEWDEDIPQNIAPVLSAFVRGTYRARRETWTPPPGKGGVQL